MKTGSLCTLFKAGKKSLSLSLLPLPPPSPPAPHSSLYLKFFHWLYTPSSAELLVRQSRISPKLWSMAFSTPRTSTLSFGTNTLLSVKTSSLSLAFSWSSTPLTGQGSISYSEFWHICMWPVLAILHTTCMFGNIAMIYTVCYCSVTKIASD